MGADVVALLAELVSINSVNASMQGGPGEAELAQRVAAYGRDLGASVTLEEVLPGRPNVTLTLPGTSEGPARRLIGRAGSSSTCTWIRYRSRA